MAIQTIKLGGFVDEEIKKINDNFAECYTGNVPTKTSELTNDSDYQTGAEVAAAIGAITVPSKVSDLTNDAGYQTAEQVAQAVNGVVVPTKVSDLTNDSGYQTAAQVTSAVNAAVGEIEVPTKLSELTNDANYVKTTDSAFLNKVDKVAGKALSTNDYTAEDKAKVEKLGKIDFTTSNFSIIDNYMTATLSAVGKYPVKVMRQSGTDYEEVIVHTKVSGNNIVIVSSEAFNGYVITL